MTLPASLSPGAQPRRIAKGRDRHGRGLRGAAALPGPLTPEGIGFPAGPAERFDDLALAAAHEVAERWQSHLGGVEFGVEDTPLLPEGYAESQVPLATLVRTPGHAPDRIVLFRRPMERRTSSRAELAALVLAVVIEQVAELLGRDPHDIDPRYG